MKVSYTIPNMDMRVKNRFIADLLGYRLQRDIEVEQKLTKLSDNKTWIGRIIDASKGSATGLTVDNIIQGLQTALNVSIFSFKVNGVDVFKLFEEHLKVEPLVLEVEMSDLYFSSRIALEQSLKPGFRKNVTTEYINERMERTKMAWLFQFEKQVTDWFDPGKVQRKIIEEKENTLAG